MNKNRQVLFTLLLGFLLLVSGAARAAPFVVKDIRVEGLQRISAGAVFTYLPFEVGDRIRDEDTAQIIRALYKTGFFKDVRLARDGNVLVITVQERPAISEINISGNKDISTEDLKLGLKDVGLSEGRVFDKLVLERIKRELKRQYFDRGKYSVQIETTVTPLERNRV
ncbi:MAG: POTRA domain-containing protein, partial [Pseudomonadota bacterium]